MELYCTTCQFLNAPEAHYCACCGRPLSQDADTRPFEEPPMHLRSRRGTACVVTFQVAGDELAMVLNLAERLILGRQDSKGVMSPDLDLGGYRAQELGISRVHAVLEYDDRGLTLTDLGSRNGTFVDGQRLHPHHALSLQSGDLIRLGNLEMQVALEIVSKPPAQVKSRGGTGQLRETLTVMRV